MKIAIGCDHIVTPIKNEVVNHLKKQGHQVIDCGTYDSTRTHFPIYGRAVALNVITKKADLGIVICGTGVGITNTVNKIKGIRCALVRDVTTAVVAKEEYNANVIGFGGRITGMGLITAIVDSFISAKYKGGNKALIKELDGFLKKPNMDPNYYSKEINKWECGGYTEGEKQEKIPMPKR